MKAPGRIAGGVVLAGAALGLGALAAPSGRPALVWNATASAPLGLYRVRPARPLRLGDWVLVKPGAGTAIWMARRGYLPRGALLVKQVAALPRQVVCGRAGEISIDGRRAARARRRDRQGRSLPAWRGCVRLGPGAIFLLNAPPDSLDGRYLGPTACRQVVGRVAPLWTRGAR